MSDLRSDPWREAAEQAAELEGEAAKAQDVIDRAILGLNGKPTVCGVVKTVHAACHTMPKIKPSAAEDVVLVQTWLVSVLEAAWRQLAKAEW